MQDGFGARFARWRLGLAVQVPQHGGERLEPTRERGAFGGLFFLQNGERATVKRLGLVIDSVLAVELRQKVETSPYLPMLASQKPLLYRDQALVKQFSFRIAALHT